MMPSSDPVSTFPPSSLRPPTEIFDVLLTVVVTGIISLVTVFFGGAVLAPSLNIFKQALLETDFVVAVKSVWFSIVKGKKNATDGD